MLDSKLAKTVLLLVLGVAVLGGATAVAQVPEAPLDPEGPELPPPGDPGSEIPFCSGCCRTWQGASKQCRAMCNCRDVPDAHPCSVSQAAEKHAASDEAKFDQWSAMAAIWEALAERYPEHATTYRKYNARIGILFLRDPGLARRSARFVAGIAPGMAATLTGDEKAVQADPFNAEDLRLLRRVLGELSRLDRRYFDGGLADAIEKMVTPGLDEAMVGKTQMEALDCVLAAKCET